jgi:hypothetical protein
MKQKKIEPFFVVVEKGKILAGSHPLASFLWIYLSISQHQARGKGWCVGAPLIKPHNSLHDTKRESEADTYVRIRTLYKIDPIDKNYLINRA